MSQYGNLKHIVDLETMLGYKLSKVDFSSITDDSISYSWGDESELINWIKLKDDKTKYGGNFYTISGTDKVNVNQKKKYPLVWLVTPVLGENQGDIKHFNRVSLIVCTNTTEEWLNSTRWNKHIPMLQAIADNIIDKLKGSVRIVRNNGVLNYSYRTIPKYSVSESGGKESESKALDIWDAVVIDLELIIDSSCRDADYYNFCNN